MVNFTELRIGNWIYSDGEPATIYMIDRGGISFYRLNDINAHKETGRVLETHEDRFNGIRITDFILEKAGFLNGRKGLLHLQCSNIDCKHDYWVVAQYDQIDGQGHLLQDLQIKYVHELQNLYFALNREELKLEL